MKDHGGGRRSLQIVQTLDRARFTLAASVRASRAVGDLEWRPAQAGAIQRDDQRATWQSGNVQAILSDGQVVIAGAQSGGVWLINPIVSPSYRDGYRATPLSDNWDTPNVLSLAYGPDGTQHVFVGCREADSLFLIEFQAVTGALVVKRSDLAIALPSRSSVSAITVIDNPRRLVIGTDGGVFWSDVPVATVDVASYVWKPAIGLPPGGPCSSLVRGPGTSVAASASDPPNMSSLHPTDPISRLFLGDWQDGTLAFQPAAVPEVARSSVYGFVLASCFSARQRMYGTAMDDDAKIRCVLRSDDGGHSWTPGSMPQNGGEQGYHNRAIAVSPYRPDVVALGWQAAGPFLSTDGGANWTLLSGGDGIGVDGLPCAGSPKGLHSDLHSLYFPLNSLGADHLIIASDGGVIATRDLGRCFDSQYNRGLAALQFYGPGYFPSAGTLSVSSRFPGLLAGGTQDNGNIILHPDADAGSVWHQLVGGDGGITRFVDSLSALLHVSNGQPHVRMTTWNETTRAFPGPGAVVPKEGDTGGLIPTALEAVIQPAWRRAGQLLYACAGSSTGDVYGLFADADGGNAAFLRIANVGQSVTAVASLSGAEILVACADKRMIAVDSMSHLWTEQLQDSSVQGFGGVSRIEVVSKDLAYALRGRELLRFDGQKWTALPANQGWLIFTVDRVTGRLFAATEADVFSSSDGGKTWIDASRGLPALPYCTDLRIGDNADGSSTLYLTTYGRSVWRATITLPPDTGPNLELPPQALEVLFGVIQDGGGIVRIGKSLVRIPPRQPETDILAGLAIDQIAQGMSAEAGREIRRATLQQIAKVVGRALEMVG